MRNINHYMATLRFEFRNKELTRMQNMQDEPGKYIHRWFQPNRVNLTSYEGIIRHLSYMLEVTVVRNQYNIREGIFIIGRGYLVSLFYNYLENIIFQIEKQTRNTPGIPGVHKTGMYGRTRIALIKKVIESLLILGKLKHHKLGEWPWYKDRQMRKEYKKNNSGLKIKKSYYASAPITRSSRPSL